MASILKKNSKMVLQWLLSLQTSDVLHVKKRKDERTLVELSLAVCFPSEEHSHYTLSATSISISLLRVYSVITLSYNKDGEM